MRFLKRWATLSSLILLVAILFITAFGRTGTRVAEMVMNPWLEVCRALTPVTLQARGNILLGLIWFFSGIGAYALIIGGLAIGCSAMTRKLAALNKNR